MSNYQEIKRRFERLKEIESIPLGKQRAEMPYDEYWMPAEQGELWEKLSSEDIPILLKALESAAQYITDLNYDGIPAWPTLDDWIKDAIEEKS